MSSRNGYSRSEKLRILLYLRSRKRRSNAMLYFIMCSIAEYTNVDRSIWVKPRSQSFWNENMMIYWSNDDWQSNLRMNKEAFTYICEMLSPHIGKQDTNFRKSISVEMRVAITLYFFSGTAGYRTISNLFGVGRSTVCTIVQAVSKAIVNILLPKYMNLPSHTEIPEIMTEFEEMSGFPQAIGAIDGCHIRIKAPLKNAEDYINRKDYHSIILQGHLFRDIFVGWTGKTHDARVFKNSPLYQECLQRTFLPMNLSRNLQGSMVPPLLLGDSAYPLEEFIMKPYADRGSLSEQEKLFNVALSQSRVVVENAFGRLKGRLRCLSKRLDTSVQNAVIITSACCILHNFCELCRQEFPEEWLQDVDVDMVHNLPYPGTYRAVGYAQEIRDKIKEYISNM